MHLNRSQEAFWCILGHPSVQADPVKVVNLRDHSDTNQAAQVQPRKERLWARQLLRYIAEKMGSLAPISVIPRLERIASKCLNNTDRALLFKLKAATMLAVVDLATTSSSQIEVGSVCLACWLEAFCWGSVLTIW